MLRISLFGRMRAEDSAGQSILSRSRKTRAVLAVLAVGGSRPLLRSRLTGLLWSRRGKQQAQASLRQCVHELQQTLGHQSGLLHADRHHLTLFDERLWVDAVALASCTKAQPEALGLFQGTLLDDLAGIDPAFDHWRADQHLRIARFARGLAESVLAAQHETEAIISAAEQLLRIDCFHESAWQALIRAHVGRGDRAAAILAFERCTATLANAGVAPSFDTEDLVRGGRSVSLLSTGPAGSVDSVLGDGLPSATRSGRMRRNAYGVRLAVLPPRALGGSSEASLPIGLAEEITAALANFRWISCIASMSLTATSGRATMADQTWHQLDLDFLLESTIQQVGSRIRVIARLLDVRAGGKVAWARRFDRDVGDILMLQEGIAAEIAAQMDPELLLREGERAVLSVSDEPTAYDLVLRAIPTIFSLDPARFLAAGDILAAAASVDPGSATVHAWWAYWHLFLLGQGWAQDPATATLRAVELAARAAALDPRDARALTLVGHIRGFLLKRTDEAHASHERALSLNPNLPLAWCFSGLTHCYTGSHDTAIEHIAQAQRLSPHDPHRFFFDAALMMPHFLRGEYDEAAEFGRRAIELNPDCSSTYKGYLATLGHLRRDDEAAAVLVRLLKLEPGFSISTAIERSPMRREGDLALYAEGLRLAGLRQG